VNGVLEQGDIAVGEHIRIGQFDGEHRIVVAQVRSKQQGLEAVQDDLQVGEISGIVVEEAIFAARRRAYVSMAVEDDEGVALL
jgi:hypothetical protein